MKRIALFSLTGVLLYACGGDDSGTGTPDDITGTPDPITAHLVAFNGATSTLAASPVAASPVAASRGIFPTPESAPASDGKWVVTPNQVKVTFTAITLDGPSGSRWITVKSPLTLQPLLSPNCLTVLSRFQQARIRKLVTSPRKQPKFSSMMTQMVSIQIPLQQLCYPQPNQPVARSSYPSPVLSAALVAVFSWPALLRSTRAITSTSTLSAISPTPSLWKSLAA